MDTRNQARALTLGLSLLLGAGSTGTALAQHMGWQMMDNERATGTYYRGMGPGMNPEMARSEGIGPGRGLGPGMGMMGPGQGMRPGQTMMQEMGAIWGKLSDDQRSELRELMREYRPAQFERMGHAQNVREELIAELQQDRPDLDDVREIHRRMTEIQGEIMVERVRMRNAIYDLLTDEQREQLGE